MNTKVMQVPKAGKAREEILQLAASIIRENETVAFPTETVYGLGANCYSEAAVERIFRAKGRPQDNPLIVHVDSPQMALAVWGELDSLWRKRFELLAQRFWPGPLAIIGPKGPKLAPAVTAGLETVAVRMPDHPVALGLIRHSGIPIAAPSANRSGKPSPTRAWHVLEDLGGKVGLILDGGPTGIGLESTVLDLLSNPPRIFRPGGVTLQELEACLGSVQYATKLSEGEAPRSPGLKYRHYSPQGEVHLVEGPFPKLLTKIEELLALEKAKGRRVGVLVSREALALRGFPGADLILLAGERRAPETIGANLFAHFRTFDQRGLDVVLMEGIDAEGVGAAVMNRARRAATTVYTVGED